MFIEIHKQFSKHTIQFWLRNAIIQSDRGWIHWSFPFFVFFWSFQKINLFVSVYNDNSSSFFFVVDLISVKYTGYHTKKCVFVVSFISLHFITSILCSYNSWSTNFSIYSVTLLLFLYLMLALFRYTMYSIHRSFRSFCELNLTSVRSR